jgi:hypothetical protein
MVESPEPRQQPHYDKHEVMITGLRACIEKFAALGDMETVTAYQESLAKFEKLS